MNIAGAKFEEHCLNISRVILNWMLCCFSGTTYDVVTFLICIIQLRKYLQNEKRYSKKENAIPLHSEKPFKQLAIMFYFIGPLTYKLISPERSNHTIVMGYRNLAVHISLNPIGRSFPWQLRKLNWTNLFERSTNQPLFPAVFFPLNTRNTFDFSCNHLMKLCGFLHGCTSRSAKFCRSSESLSRVFQLVSIALVCSTSQKSRHCLVLSPFSSPDSI